MDNVVRTENKPFIWALVTEDFHLALFLWSEENPPVEWQLYLFMKRFRTQPSEFFGMDRNLRLSLYQREMDVVKKENEEADKLSKPNEL